MHEMYINAGRITNQSINIDEKIIHNQLMNYPSTSSGIGLVFIVELLDDPAELFSGYLVWFDIETKKIIVSKRLEGKPYGARPTISKWGGGYSRAMTDYFENNHFN